MPFNRLKHILRLVFILVLLRFKGFGVVKYGSCLVPPEYVIELKVTDTFIISDIFDSDDANDFSNDDMEVIKDSELTMVKPENEKKYFMLDRIADRKNRETQYESNSFPEEEEEDSAKIVDYDYDFEDDASYGMFLDSNKLEEDLTSNKKRANGQNPLQNIKRDDYHYGLLKVEYEQLAEKEAKSKNVLKYVDVTEKEGLKDAAKNIIKNKAVKNCTAEEMKGIGFNAMKCYLKDIKSIKKMPKETRKILFKRLLKIVLIWLGVYVVIAVPCWCTRGWCCCCCRCKFCKPRIIIDEAKQFLANNPVGVLHIDGKEVTYTPTVYEQYAQQRLEKVVMSI